MPVSGPPRPADNYRKKNRWRHDKTTAAGFWRVSRVSIHFSFQDEKLAVGGK
jgi:hypothetical protein